MHPDIQKAIELIDRKIAGLQTVRDALISEFGDVHSSSSEKKTSSIPDSPRSSDGPKPPTRKEQIIKLLEVEGPLSRSEIVKKSGIPEGTVANTLNDKVTFESLLGKWRLKESTKRRVIVPIQSEELSSAAEAEIP